jgi:glycosyltransferase involved in cell wall biosynthesis
VEHGRTGFLVDDLQEAQLAVREIRELDRATVRRTVLERFSVGRMVDDYEEVYRKLAASSGPDDADGDEARAPLAAVR